VAGRALTLDSSEQEYLKPLNLRRSLAITPPIWGQALRRPAIIPPPIGLFQDQRASASAAALPKASLSPAQPTSIPPKAAVAAARSLSPVPPSRGHVGQAKAGVDTKLQSKQESRAKAEPSAPQPRASDARQHGLKVESRSQSRSASPALGHSGVAANRTAKSPEHTSERRSKGSKKGSHRRGN